MTEQTTTSRTPERGGCVAGQDHQPETYTARGQYRTMCRTCGRASNLHPTAGASVTEYVEQVGPGPLMLSSRSAYVGQVVEVWQHPNVQPAAYQGSVGRIAALYGIGGGPLAKPSASVELAGDVAGAPPVNIPLGHLIATGDPDIDPQPEYAHPVEMTALERGLAAYLGDAIEEHGTLDLDAGMDRGEYLSVEAVEYEPGSNGFTLLYRDRHGRPKVAGIKIKRSE